MDVEVTSSSTTQAAFTLENVRTENTSDICDAQALPLRSRGQSVCHTPDSDDEQGKISMNALGAFEGGIREETKLPVRANVCLFLVNQTKEVYTY